MDDVKMLCPNCNTSHPSKVWNEATLHFTQNDLPLEEAKMRRDLHKEKEYVCPHCLHGILLMHIVPDYGK